MSEIDPPKEAAASAKNGDVDDRPWGRFWVTFIITTPLVWIASVGYGRSSPLKAAVIALLVALVIGLIAATGKKAFDWIINFLTHGGI